MKNYSKNIKGASMVEYALLATLVALAGVITLGKIGTQMNTKLTSVYTNLGGT